MPATSTVNEQVIEAFVSGPDGANRLLTCTGQAPLGMYAGGGQSLRDTWTFLVGPALPHPQFHRATASVFVAGYAIYVPPVTDPMMANAWHSLDFQSVEADWDDESGKTQMHVEVALSTGTGLYFTLSKIGFSVTVLAESTAP